MLSFIPLKNMSVEDEKAFLEKRMKDGFKLTKKGLFLYRFDRQSPQNSYFNILIVEDISKIDNDNDVIDIQVIQKIRFLNLYKIYFSSNINGYSSDSSLLQKYYKHFDKIYSGVALILFMTLFLATTIAYTGITLFKYFWSVYILLLFLFIFFLIISITIEKIIKIQAKRLGIKDIPSVHYVLTLKNVDDEKLIKVPNELLKIGYVDAVSKNLFRIQTNFKREDIRKVLVDKLEIKETDFKLMHTGDLK